VRLRHRRASAADRATIAADGNTNSPEIEKYVIESGIILIKIWLEVGQEEQERRFRARMGYPLRQWKLSPMELESYKRWYDYSAAREAMLDATDSKHAPWFIIRSDDKRRARLNCISHILGQSRSSGSTVQK
jgi:polyphosphate kinase 2 (PPK2 family)